MSVEQYVQQAGISPAVFNVYTTLPMDGNSTTVINTALPQLAAMKALVHLTVEPQDGLSAVTYQAIGKLAYYIKNAQLVRLVACRRLPCHIIQACSALATACKKIAAGLLTGLSPAGCKICRPAGSFIAFSSGHCKLCLQLCTHCNLSAASRALQLWTCPALPLPMALTIVRLHICRVAQVS